MSEYPEFTPAAIQAAPILFDREASTGKACGLIAQAAERCVDGSGKNLGRYAASWIACWPKRPSSTAALT